jgi:hypothetical protein
MSSSALDAAEAVRGHVRSTHTFPSSPSSPHLPLPLQAILSLADIAGNTVLALSRGPAEAERVKELSREYLGKVEVSVRPSVLRLG